MASKKHPAAGSHRASAFRTSLPVDPFLPLARSGIRPGLTRIRRLLHHLGNPERRMRTVLIAGSNGKGTTAAMLEAMLRAAGYRTGLFTSPHLVAVTERFRVDGKCAGGAMLARFMRLHGQAIGKIGATYFEATTACALWLFARRHVAWAVLEIGLGGRWDACNAAEPDVSIITSISLEHTEFLGATEAAIAREKAQVAREGKPVLVGRVSESVRASLKREFIKLRAVPYWLGQNFEIVHPTYSPAGATGTLLTGGGRLLLRSAIRGKNALDNAALAACALGSIASATSESPSPHEVRRAIRTGSSTVCWPGRLEVVRRRPLVVLDVAHNTASFLALAADWKRHWPGVRPVVVVGLLAEKDPDPIGKALAQIAAEVIVTTPQSARAASPGLLARLWQPQFARIKVLPDLAAAVTEAIRRTAPGHALLITGSHFLVGPARQMLAI